jgi:hypothetical protein
MCTGFSRYHTIVRDPCKSFNAGSKGKFGRTVSMYALTRNGAKLSDTQRTKVLASRLYHDGRRGDSGDGNLNGYCLMLFENKFT